MEKNPKLNSAKNQSLHPEIVFHFTDKKGLFKILEETFKVSYARERIVSKNGTDKLFAVPIVSFCDLRLSELKMHMSSYGHYGIGLTKAWAKREGLNPVWYINQNSPIANELFTGVQELFDFVVGENNSEVGSELSDSYSKILSTYRCVKNYEGELIRRGRLVEKNYRFADEREWRFAPQVPFELSFIAHSKIETSQQKAVFNKRVAHLRLPFQPDDIKYLIVRSDADIPGLLNHLATVKRGFDPETLNRLATRILTSEQIHNDV
jgi:hypothetical protein